MKYEKLIIIKIVDRALGWRTVNRVSGGVERRQKAVTNQWVGTAMQVKPCPQNPVHYK